MQFDGLPKQAGGLPAYPAAWQWLVQPLGSARGPSHRLAGGRTVGKSQDYESANPALGSVADSLRTLLARDHEMPAFTSRNTPKARTRI